MAILQFHISLEESRPLIWRRIQVTDDYRFDRFHQVIQLAMGWWNYHLHEFVIGKRRVGMVLGYDDGYPEPEDETKLRLRDFKFYPGDSFKYQYDFGDDWWHLIEVESVSGGTIPMPICLGGQRRCPPEDCGGISGFSEMLKAIENRRHPEYHEWRTWLPDDYDSAIFPIQEVNEELTRFGEWHQKHPRAKSTPWHQLK